MPITEIRETLEQGSVIVGEEDDFVIVQKRIDLQSGMRHTMVHVDFMDDSFILPSDATVRGFEFFLSPYPIVYTEMLLAEVLENRGPCGADDQVLFKKTKVQSSGAAGGVYEAQMPSQFLSTMPTYTWYTPTLYLTAFIRKEVSGPNWDIEDLAMSVYCAIEHKNVNAIEYGIGIIREYDQAQGRNIMSQGRQILPANNVGQCFPMWRAGGVRSERMIRGGPSQADFFLKGAMNLAEQVMPQNNLRIWMRRAGTMVGPTEAFGDDDPAKGEIPDWVRFELHRMNMYFGDQRAEFPPVVKADSGITRMV